MKRALLFVAILWIAPANAASTQFTIHGQGTVSCGVWKQARLTDRWYPESGWVLGYLTAYNEYHWTKTDDIASGTDSDGIAAWIDGYCAVHPLNTIAQAARQLIVVFQVRQMGGSLQNEYGP